MVEVRPISTYVSGTYVGTGQLLHMTWYYDPHAPYELAVEIADRAGESSVLWVVGRDLVADGLAGSPAGEGDVQLQTVGNLAYLLLHNGTDTARIAFVAAAVNTFLRATYRMVPRGKEPVDWDRVVDQLLAGDPS